MNVSKVKLLTAAAISLLFLDQPVFAQSNCKAAKGDLSEVWLPQVNSHAGTLSNAGWLNGTTLHVEPPPYLFVLPGVAIWTGQLTITTGQGDLKASTLFLAIFQPVAKGSVIGVIDPAASTGIFAGATGTLFVNTFEANITANPETYRSEVHGQVCFARQ
jgi:hypothetical protein